MSLSRDAIYIFSNTCTKTTYFQVSKTSWTCEFSNQPEEHPPMEMKYKYMRHIQLETKIYFGVIQIYVKYILNKCQIYFGKFINKIYVKYILNTQLLEKIYFIHFDIYLTYIQIVFFSILFHVGRAETPWRLTIFPIRGSIFEFFSPVRRVFSLFSSMVKKQLLARFRYSRIRDSWACVKEISLTKWVIA